MRNRLLLFVSIAIGALCALVVVFPARGQDVNTQAIDQIIHTLLAHTKSPEQAADVLMVEAKKLEPKERAAFLERAYALGVEHQRGLDMAALAAEQMMLLRPDERFGWMLHRVGVDEARLNRARGSERKELTETLTQQLLRLPPVPSDPDLVARALPMYARAAAQARAQRLPGRLLLQKRMVGLQHAVRKYGLAEKLARQLKAGEGGDAQRKELMHLYAVELARPDLAWPYADGLLDDPTTKILLLAVQKPTDLTADQLLELGTWRHQRSRESGDFAEPHHLLAAERLLQVAAEQETESLKAIKANALLKTVRARMETLRVVTDSFLWNLKSALKKIEVVSAGYTVGNRIRIAYDGKSITEGVGEPYRGFNLVAIVKDKVIKSETFDTFLSKEEAGKLAAAINELPKDAVVIVALCDAGIKYFTPEAQRAMESIGAATDIKNLKERTSYYCIGQKGMNKGEAVEKHAGTLIAYPPDKETEPAGSFISPPPRRGKSNRSDRTPGGKSGRRGRSAK